MPLCRRVRASIASQSRGGRRVVCACFRTIDPALSDLVVALGDEYVKRGSHAAALTLYENALASPDATVCRGAASAAAAAGSDPQLSAPLARLKARQASSCR
jgi:hypothetical protein